MEQAHANQPETENTPNRPTEASPAIFDHDAKYVSMKLQERYSKDHPEYEQTGGTKLITEALELAQELLQRNKKEGDDTATLQTARRELTEKTDERVASRFETTNREALLMLIELIDSQFQPDLLFDLATNIQNDDTSALLNQLYTTYASRETKPIPLELLSQLIQESARQHLLKNIGEDFFDELQEFEKKRAAAPQAMAELIKNTPKPETPPTS